MTNSQLNIILTDLGYPQNRQIKANQISVISSDLDGCIYTGDGTRLNFNTVKGILEVYYGKEKDGEFIFKGTAPSYAIPLENIYGITLVSPIHNLEPYKTGQAV